MKFELDTPPDGQRIKRYSERSVVVNDTEVEHTFIVTNDRLLIDVELPPLLQLDVTAVGMFLELGPDIVVIGCGSRQQMIDTRLMAELMQAGVGVEVMDTPAACRCFNVLSGENRRVAAALYPIDDSNLRDPSGLRE